MERLTEKDNIGAFHYKLKRKSKSNEFNDYDAFFDYHMAVKRLGELEDANEPRHIDEWHEDDGDCLWWSFPIEEPPYCGNPLDRNFPEHVTHFTKLILPIRKERLMHTSNQIVMKGEKTMSVNVKKISFDESILEVYTKSGIKTLKIIKTQYGHSYEDFAEWDITDEQYYALEELMEDIIERMKNYNVLNVSWEC